MLARSLVRMCRALVVALSSLACFDSVAHAQAAPTASLALAVAPPVPSSCASGATPDGRVAPWDAAWGAIPVWVQRYPASVGDGARLAIEYDWAVDRAAAAWAGVVPGVRLVRVADSARAAVWVVWRRTLDRPPVADRAVATAGRTWISSGRDGGFIAAVVAIATHGGGGVSFGPADVAVVAQHEFGHVLGLPHRADPASVMAARPVVDGPSAADRDALRRLYAGGAHAACDARADAAIATLSPTP